MSLRIVLTGSSGRVGRAIFGALAADHEIIGIDRTAFSTTHFVDDFTNESLLREVLRGTDAVVHTAALHAPHVGIVPDTEFRRINVEGTLKIAELARKAGVSRFVFTSTTALYGYAVAPGTCTWIDENTPPKPKTVYHRTKLEAELLLENLASEKMPVRVMRMSRSFPEPADLMAAFRLHRGVDVRDVAKAHAVALTNDGPTFQRYIISGLSPFEAEDCSDLSSDAAAVIARKVPEFLDRFAARGWDLPHSIDRIYSSRVAQAELGWTASYGFEEVLAQADRGSLEVLPHRAATKQRLE